MKNHNEKRIRGRNGEDIISYNSTCQRQFSRHDTPFSNVHFYVSISCFFLWLFFVNFFMNDPRNKIGWLCMAICVRTRESTCTVLPINEVTVPWVYKMGKNVHSVPSSHTWLEALPTWTHRCLWAVKTTVLLSNLFHFWFVSVWLRSIFLFGEKKTFAGLILPPKIW